MTPNLRSNQPSKDALQSSPLLPGRDRDMPGCHVAIRNILDTATLIEDCDRECTFPVFDTKEPKGDGKQIKVSPNDEENTSHLDSPQGFFTTYHIRISSLL